MSRLIARNLLILERPRLRAHAVDCGQMRVDEALTLPRSSDATPRTSTRRSALRLSGELIAFEIKKSSAGSVLGVAWAVVQPLLLVGSYWFLLSILGARRPGS